MTAICNLIKCLIVPGLLLSGIALAQDRSVDVHIGSDGPRVSVQTDKGTDITVGVDSQGPHVSVAPPDAPAPPVGGTWHVSDDPPFLADQQPSLNAAARALARQVIDMLPSVTSDGGKPPIVQIWGSTSPGGYKFDRTVLAEMGEILRVQGGIDSVLVESVVSSVKERIHDVDKNGVTLELSLNSYTLTTIRPWDSTRDEILSGGSLQVDIWGEKSHFCRTMSFVVKPWADDFAAFVARYPQQSWILAQTPNPAATEFEASQAAVHDAAEKLAARLNTDGADPVAIDLVEAQLHLGTAIADRFMQRFERPYGDVWREALLIDADADSLTALQAKQTQVTTQRRRSFLGHIGVLAVLLGVISALYLFLNTATKGYFTWSLRLLAAALALAAMLVILARFRFHFQ